MKILKELIHQLFNVLITILVLYMVLTAFDYKVSKAVTNNDYELVDDKEKMAALIRASDHTEIIQYAIDTDDKEMKNYIIYSLMNKASRIEEEEVKKLITELTIQILEEE